MADTEKNGNSNIQKFVQGQISVKAKAK